MKTINESKDLTEDEKKVIGIIRELETREKNPKTREITISESLKITLTVDGIKQLKMISENNIDSDSAIRLLIGKNLVTHEETELKLTEDGVKIGKEIRSKQLSDWYNKNLLRCAKSKAYALFCTKVFGKNLSQFNVLDMEQLETLISTLDLNSDDSVLDLGSGLGKITEYIQMSTGAKIIGIDFAEELVNWANENTKNDDEKLTFFIGNMNNLEFPQASFNAIYAIDTLYPTNINDLEATIATLKNFLKSNGQMGIFFAQIIESKEFKNTLEPNNTQMANALKKNGFSFTTIDFTQNARDIWAREISVGNELRELFEKEGNLDLCKERIADGKRCIYRIDNQLQKRYFYHVHN
jgi:ubiquinone/menaquinone biosynthesis C-methylase UbiE